MGRLGFKFFSRSRFSSKREIHQSESLNEQNSPLDEPGETDLSSPDPIQPPQAALETPRGCERVLRDDMGWDEKREEEEDAMDGRALEGPDTEAKSPERFEAELQDRLEAIIGLKNLVNSQRQTIQSLRDRHRAYKQKVKRQSGHKYSSVLSFVSEDESSLRGPTFGDEGLYDFPRKYTVSFGPSLEKTDVDVLSVISYEDCDSIDLEHMEDAFRAAAEEIRKQASQMEVAIALDKLDTTEDELQRVTRKLELRSAELEDVKEELKKTNRRLSKVEQERDLFEADAVRAKEDLDACLAQLMNVDTLSVCNEEASLQQTALPCDSSSAISSLTEDVYGPSPMQGSLRKSIEQWEDRCVIEAQRASSTGTNHTVWSSKKHVHLERDGDHLGNERNKGSRFDWSPYGQPSVSGAASDRSEEVHGPVKSSRVHRFGFPRQRRGEERKHPRRFRGYKHGHQRGRHRSVKNRELPDTEPECAATGSVLNESVLISPEPESSQLNHGLDSIPKSPPRTTHELQKRLSTVSRYYENVVGSLQRNIVDLKTEKTRLENDQKTHVSSIDHENRKLEAQLRERDETIMQLQCKKSILIQEEDFNMSSPPRFC